MNERSEITQRSTDAKTLRKAIKAADKKIRTLPTKALNHNLEYVCGDFADAYRCGVVEAQCAIVKRLQELAK